MSAPLAVRLDDTILAWLPYAALIMGQSVFVALCSQLKFTRSVKFNYKLIMINNKHSFKAQLEIAKISFQFRKTKLK